MECILKMIKWLVSFFSLAASTFCFSGHETFVSCGNVKLWCETFGLKVNPPILLIMGAGAQGIEWPTRFCEKLARFGFFVIRYDHRDTGLSSCVDYARCPYDLYRLAQDAICVLDAFHIQKAHIVGASMGGCIAIIIGASFPSRVCSIIPMMATSDLRCVTDGFCLPSLPRPKKEFLRWLDEAAVFSTRNCSEDEEIDFHVKGWKILNGPEAFFDKKFYRKLVKKIRKRERCPNGISNHLAAIRLSCNQYRELLPFVYVPTLIIHGTCDPVFSVEHAIDLVDCIPDGTLALIDGMGHCLNPIFFDEVIETIFRYTEELDDCCSTW